MSINEQLPPSADQQDYQAAPPPPQKPGMSALAVIGFILAFLFSPIGFILSLIAIFQTGPGKKSGRGLAIAGTIISALAIAVGIFVVAKVVNSTVADPGCVDGKQAILDGGNAADPASLQKVVDGLDAAAAKAKNDDVKTAMTALSGDYKQLLNGLKTGQMPAGLEAKVTADANRIDELCTIGS